MKIRTVLEKMYKILEDKSSWIKGSNTNTHNYETATKFCLDGALRKVTKVDSRGPTRSTERFLNRLASKIRDRLART